MVISIFQHKHVYDSYEGGDRLRDNINKILNGLQTLLWDSRFILRK